MLKQYKKVEVLTLPDFKIYYKAVVNKVCTLLQQPRDINAASFQTDKDYDAKAVCNWLKISFLRLELILVTRGGEFVGRDKIAKQEERDLEKNQQVRVKIIMLLDPGTFIYKSTQTSW